MNLYEATEVVYLLIPTSNHNPGAQDVCGFDVVYLLIPTSNHNKWIVSACSRLVVYLLIPTSNHNCVPTIYKDLLLYIF